MKNNAFLLASDALVSFPKAVRKMNVKLLMLYGSRECITYLFCCCNRVPQPKNLEKKAFNWACVSLGLESMMVELRYGDRNS